MSDVRYLQMIERDASGNMLSAPTLVKFNKNGQVLDSRTYNLPDDNAAAYLPPEISGGGSRMQTTMPQQSHHLGMRFLPASSSTTTTSTQPIPASNMPSSETPSSSSDDTSMDEMTNVGESSSASWLDKMPILAWGWRAFKNTPLIFAAVSMLVNTWLLVYGLLWVTLRYYAWSSDDARRGSTLFDVTTGLIVWSLSPLMMYQLYVYIHKSIQYFVYHKFVIENVAAFKLLTDTSTGGSDLSTYTGKSVHKRKRVHKVIMKDSFDMGAHIMWVASRMSGANAFIWAWLVVSMTKGNRYLLKLIFHAVMMGFITIWIMNVYNVFMVDPNALGIESIRHARFIEPTYDTFQSYWNDITTYLLSARAPIHPGAPAAPVGGGQPSLTNLSPQQQPTTPYAAPSLNPDGSYYMPPPTVSLRGGIL